MARIIRFNAPTNLMLSKRLTDICTLEGLKIDSRNMSLLIELSHGDLRSCLNTLQVRLWSRRSRIPLTTGVAHMLETDTQFIRRRSRVVDESTIKSASIGSKDSGTSPSAVWDRLFRRTNPKQAQQTADRYVERLVRDVQTCGEYDKLVQGALCCRPWSKTGPLLTSQLQCPHRLLRDVLACQAQVGRLGPSRSRTRVAAILRPRRHAPAHRSRL